MTSYNTYTEITITYMYSYVMMIRKTVASLCPYKTEMRSFFCGAYSCAPSDSTDNQFELGW